MLNTDPVPNPVLDRDVRALIGLLAILQGELMVEAVHIELAGLVRDRFVLAGLLAWDASISELPDALDGVNQRLRVRAR